MPTNEVNWEKAEKYLNYLIGEYEAIGTAGWFGLTLTLIPLKRRLDSGERTRKLYEEIMACE
ncbi:MAG: hypothetical protein IKL97_05320 [Eggerthellaceae bacterium]|nr:hypothetical protein [Eggerthellaceae bacterium]